MMISPAAQFWIQLLTGLVGLNVVALIAIAWRGGHTLGVIKTDIRHMAQNKTDIDKAHERIRDLETRVAQMGTGNVANRSRE